MDVLTCPGCLLSTVHLNLVRPSWYLEAGYLPGHKLFMEHGLENLQWRFSCFQKGGIHLLDCTSWGFIFSWNWTPTSKCQRATPHLLTLQGSIFFILNKKYRGQEEGKFASPIPPLLIPGWNPMACGWTWRSGTVPQAGPTHLKMSLFWSILFQVQGRCYVLIKRWWQCRWRGVNGSKIYWYRVGVTWWQMRRQLWQIGSN